MQHPPPPEKNLTRSVSRALESLDFLPAVLLLLVFFGSIAGWHFLKNWNPRSAEETDQQFAALQTELEAWGDSRGVELRIPGRESWRHRSFGELDEWRGSVWIQSSAAGVDGETEKPVVIEFNLSRQGLKPRMESLD